MVKERVDSRQYSKYRSTLEEFDQVTHLLLMLSSRLANTDNSLDQISFSDQEQQKVGRARLNVCINLCLCLSLCLSDPSPCFS